MSRAAAAVAAGTTLLEQSIRQHCRVLKLPTLAAQFERVALTATREGHSHLQYLEALLSAEVEERDGKAVLRRVQEARLRGPAAAGQDAGGVHLCPVGGVRRPACRAGRRRV